MDTRTVYRYEDTMHKGPYQSHLGNDSIDRMCIEHCAEHHPAWSLCMNCQDTWGCVCDDYLPEIAEEYNRTYLAACDSRESLDAWFDGWHDTLAENGFKVVEYTVPAENVIDGESGLQCAFKPVSA